MGLGKHSQTRGERTVYRSPLLGKQKRPDYADELKDADNVEDAQPDTVGDAVTDAVALRVPEEQGLGDGDVVPHCDALRVYEGVAVTHGVDD